MFPYAHNVLSLQGRITSGGMEDIWTTRLRIAGDGAPAATGAPPQALLDDIKADITTWWNALGTLYSSGRVVLDTAKFVGVGTDGKYLSAAGTPTITFGTTGLTGTSSTGMLPPQCAVAVTLLTSATRGLASRGRLFLPPMIQTAVSNDGRLSASAQNTIQTATATLLTNLNNWPGVDAAADPGNVVVASDVREGAIRKVTHVSVGNVVDTIRTRRNAFPEARVAPTAVAS